MISERPISSPDGATGGTSVWRSADGALRLTAPSALLAEICAETHRVHFGSARGTEMAGILFGRRTPAGMELAGWHPIRRDPSSGVSFTLTQRELGTLACLLDGLHDELHVSGHEVLGWFVTRMHAYSMPSRSDVELQRRFFATLGDLLLVVDPQRGGGTQFNIFLYAGAKEGLQPALPAWAFSAPPPGAEPAPPEPAPVPPTRNGEREAGPPPDESAGSSEATALAAQRRLIAAMSVPRPRHGLRDAVPYGVWHLLAGLTLIAIGAAAYLYLFMPDVVRPVVAALTAGPRVDPRSVALTVQTSGDAVTVKWNGNAPVLQNAQSVRLVFDLSADAQTLLLTPGQAHGGVYQTKMRPAPLLVTLVVMPAQGERFRESCKLTKHPDFVPVDSKR
jgi:hypothetical protein